MLRKKDETYSTVPIMEFNNDAWSIGAHTSNTLEREGKGEWGRIVTLKR